MKRVKDPATSGPGKAGGRRLRTWDWPSSSSYYQRTRSGIPSEYSIPTLLIEDEIESDYLQRSKRAGAAWRCLPSIGSTERTASVGAAPPRARWGGSSYYWLGPCELFYDRFQSQTGFLTQSKPTKYIMFLKYKRFSNSKMVLKKSGNKIMKCWTITAISRNNYRKILKILQIKLVSSSDEVYPRLKVRGEPSCWRSNVGEEK